MTVVGPGRVKTQMLCCFDHQRLQQGHYKPSC